MRIGLLEHFGSGNLGDDTTVAAVLQQIRSRWPGVEIVGLSLNPADTEKRHDIPSYPIRRDCVTAEWWSPTVVLSRKQRCCNRLVDGLRTCGLLPAANLLRECAFLFKSFRVAKTLDLLVVGGGGQLLDTWGPWGFPYTLFKWVMLIRLSGGRCYFINVGAGPLSHPLARWLVKRALCQASHISFRDAKSRALIEGLGVKRPFQVVADNVYGLKFTDHIAQRNNTLIVGLSPMAYCDPRRFWEKDQFIYDSYIEKLADFGAYIIQTGHKVSLFSSDIWFDSQALIDLETAIRARFCHDVSDRLISEPIKDAADLLSRLAAVDYSVTCRYHGVVFANLLNVPVIAIAHHPKISTLMNDFGLAEYCLDIRTFDQEQLTAAFAYMTANAAAIKVQVPRQVARYQKGLTRQFDHLFPPRKAGTAWSAAR